MKIKFADLKAEYERDRDSFQDIQFVRVEEYIEEISDDRPIIRDRLQRWLWRTALYMSYKFNGTLPQLWFVIYESLRQRNNTLRAGIDRIKVSPVPNVVYVDFRPENRLTKQA